MTVTQEIIEKHIGRLWNNSGCPVGEILGDVIRDSLERAAQECEFVGKPPCYFEGKQCAANIRALMDEQSSEVQP